MLQPGSILIRSRADASIIGVADPKTGVGVKLTRSETPYNGESMPGCIFRYTDQCWVECDDAETRAAFQTFRASGIKPFRESF